MAGVTQQGCMTILICEAHHTSSPARLSGIDHAHPDFNRCVVLAQALYTLPQVFIHLLIP